MIYFHENVVAQTVEMIKTTYDCADILNDLERIEKAKERVCNGDWLTGEELNRELRIKYPCIDKLMQIADSFPNATNQPAQILSDSKRVAILLNQDEYGILCNTAIKKGIVHGVKEFIKAVD